MRAHVSAGIMINETCDACDHHRIHLESDLTFSRIDEMFSPLDNRCACRLGSSCLSFAAAAFPSMIKHHVVSSMGPAVIALRRLMGIKN